MPVAVTFLLDELGVLGLIPKFPEYVATFRDIGVSFVIATQDRSQLVEVYGQENADTLIANLHTRLVFGRDLRPEQAEEICRALGEVQVPEPGTQFEHASPLRVRRTGTRVIYQVRRLLEPNELRALPEFHAIAVLPGDVKTSVFLPPVHHDPKYTHATKPASMLESLRHDVRMDSVLGRLSIFPPTFEWLSATTSATQKPTFEHKADSKGAGEAVSARPLVGSGDDRDSPPFTSGPDGDVGQAQSNGRGQSTGDFQSGLQRTEVRMPDDAMTAVTTVSGVSTTPSLNPDAGVRTGDSTGPGLAERERVYQSPSVAASDEKDLTAILGDFVSEVVHGELRDERLPPGSPRGWVYTDKRGEFLIPWGYFRDWAQRTERLFRRIEEDWAARGLIRGRASVTANGRAVTCLVFAKLASGQLSSELQQLIVQSFGCVSPEEVRISSRSAKGRGPWPHLVLSTNASHELNPLEARNETGAPLLLDQFMLRVQEVAMHFLGHASYRDGNAVFGRWRATSREGPVLLVLRVTVKSLFEQMGVSEPSSTLSLWKAAGFLYLGKDARGEFYTRRTHKEGREFLALRWEALAKHAENHELRA